MRKKMKYMLILVMLLAAVSLPADEAAIRKTITDCADAGAGMHTYAFNYWNPDGYLIWNGGKYALAEMKQILCPVIEDYDAWDYDSLINIRAAAGRMSDWEKKQALSINRFKKKAKFAVMKSEVKADYLAWKSIIGYVRKTLKINSVEVNGNQALVKASITNPKTFRPLNCTIKMKKTNGSWKIQTVE